MFTPGIGPATVGLKGLELFETVQLVAASTTTAQYTPSTTLGSITTLNRTLIRRQRDPDRRATPDCAHVPTHEPFRSPGLGLWTENNTTTVAGGQEVDG